jgi:hypothetical protein
MATLLRIYYEHSRICHVRSIALLAVKTCSKAILALRGRHGKSPCFLEVAFFRLVSPDHRLLILPCVNGEENLECAFWYGER